MVAEGEETGFEELRAESVEEKRSREVREGRSEVSRSGGSGFGSGFTQWRLTRGWAGRYSHANIDTLLATLAKPVAAQIAAGRASGSVAGRRVDGIHHASKTGETEVCFSMQSPDGGQATHW